MFNLLIKTFSPVLKAGLFIGLFAILISCKEKVDRYKNITVVKVGTSELKAKKFADLLAFKLKYYDALTVKDEATVSRLKENIIRNFILETLIRDWSKKNKIQVTDEELDKEIDRVRSQYPDDLAFRRNLAQEHLSLEDWKLFLKTTLLQRKLFTFFRDRIEAPSEKEIKGYYKSHRKSFAQSAQVRLKQIVVEKEEVAQKILKELKRGGNFSELAKKYSIAPEGKNGGDTGWIDLGTLPVFDQASRMSIGQRSSVLKSDFGFHIIQVTSKRDEKTLSYNAAKDKILQVLMEKREQSAYSAWLDLQLRQQRVFRDEKVISAIKIATAEN